MKPHTKFVLAGVLQCLLVGSLWAGGESTPIQEVELDEHRVVDVPVSAFKATTVSFPTTISAIQAAWVTADGKTPGWFHLEHNPRSDFFSVRSLVHSAETNVNVRLGNKTYVLLLKDSEAPLLSLVFKYGTEKKATVRGKAVTPNTLLGLLDKAKAYPVLKANQSEALGQVEYLKYDKPRIMDYNDFEIRLEEVFRFNEEDTLVFRLVLRNKTDREIDYYPQEFSVRIGEQVYWQSISDASGVMPTKADSIAYVAITGTPAGGRNDLSIKNDFTILVNRALPEEAPPPKPAKAKTKKIKGGSKK